MTRLTDDLFDALSNRYRRRILVSLVAPPRSGTLAVPEGLHQGETDLDTLQTTLFHTHLPKLDEMGFIDWNRGSHVVTTGPRLEECSPYLVVLYEHREKLPDEWD